MSLDVVATLDVDTRVRKAPCATLRALRSLLPTMMLPTFDYCIICEMVRPELGGKYILLGFYGLAPNVEILVQDTNRPIFLSILTGCPALSEATTTYECVVLITRPDGVGIFQTPPLRLVVAQDRRTLVPVAFNVPPPILPGRYSIRLTVNGELRLDTSFSVKTSNQPVSPYVVENIKKSFGPSGVTVRCPLCAWVPAKVSLWSCTCGHQWNTFDTGGVCPACSLRWTTTACLACQRSSPHSDWYKS
jgi:hypothetical protein